MNHPQGLKSIFFYNRRAYISDSMTIWTTQHNNKSLLMLRIRTLCPIPDHFWHFGPDLDQACNYGPSGPTACLLETPVASLVSWSDHFQSFLNFKWKFLYQTLLSQHVLNPCQSSWGRSLGSRPARSPPRRDSLICEEFLREGVLKTEFLSDPGIPGVRSMGLSVF